MRKGEGLAQQIRGHRRVQKTINRRLNRYASDLKKVEGNYEKWLDEKIKSDVEKISEQMKQEEKENNNG
jgi:hypothetical protein